MQGEKDAAHKEKKHKATLKAANEKLQQKLGEVKEMKASLGLPAAIEAAVLEASTKVSQSIFTAMSDIIAK